MKLISKFLFIYMIITVIVLGIGACISYYVIKDELDTELKWRFMNRINRVTYLLEQGEDFSDDRLIGQGDRNLRVTRLPRRVEPSVEIRDTMVWHHRLKQMEPNLKVSAYRNVNGDSYYISTYGALVETEDITEAVLKTILWILFLQVIGAIGLGFMISNRLFKPFRNTLQRIKNFDLQEKEPIPAEATNIKEFDDMNRFVEEMTRKAVSDYQNLKEFAENASHELQTPLAIVKGKLELLTETDLSPEQYQYVEASQRSIKKLSRLSESLALLTKIENHEFNHTDTVNLTNIIRKSTDAFEEFIKFNHLNVTTDLEENVTIQIHSVLADILWTNLFQNAIKHNIKDGCIRITLTQQHLLIANTGNELETPSDELFERFKKDNQNTNSIGLGLSIIKRIADQTNTVISYEYEEGWHTVEIAFES